MVAVRDSLLVAIPIPGGFSWTLASRLGAILSEAELRFGSRDRSFTILGVEFREGVPQIWFPGDRKDIVIQLGTICLDDEPRAVFQLAHECVHVLSPVLSGTASVIEEGVATFFAMERVQQDCGVPIVPAEQAYQRAAQLARGLMALDPGGVRRLRDIEPSLSRVTADQLRLVYPTLSDVDAAALSGRFDPSA